MTAGCYPSNGTTTRRCAGVLVVALAFFFWRSLSCPATAAEVARSIPKPLTNHPGNIFLAGESVTVALPAGADLGVLRVPGAACARLLLVEHLLEQPRRVGWRDVVEDVAHGRYLLDRDFAEPLLHHVLLDRRAALGQRSLAMRFAQARGAFVEVAGVTQPAPAPRFSRTPGGVAAPPPLIGEHSREILAEHGFDEPEIERALAAGIVQQG